MIRIWLELVSWIFLKLCSIHTLSIPTTLLNSQLRPQSLHILAPILLLSISDCITAAAYIPLLPARPLHGAGMILVFCFVSGIFIILFVPRLLPPITLLAFCHVHRRRYPGLRMLDYCLFVRSIVRALIYLRVASWSTSLSLRGLSWISRGY